LTGADNWPKDHHDCGGHFQSPINIDPTTAIRENYPRIFFGNYDKVAAENITNNGHTGEKEIFL
jgi:carbonic anhydrase